MGHQHSKVVTNTFRLQHQSPRSANEKSHQRKFVTNIIVGFLPNPYSFKARLLLTTQLHKKGEFESRDEVFDSIKFRITLT